MGFWGTLIVCHADVPLPAVPEVRALDQAVERRRTLGTELAGRLARLADPWRDPG